MPHSAPPPPRRKRHPSAPVVDNSVMRSQFQPVPCSLPVLVACAATIIGGCGGKSTPTPPPTDKLTFESTVVSRVWTSRTEDAFQLRQDGVVEWRQGPSDGSMLGRSCARASTSGGQWRWTVEAMPRTQLVLRIQSPDSSEGCPLTVDWFSDSGPLDWLTLLTPEGEQLRFFSAKP